MFFSEYKGTKIKGLLPTVKNFASLCFIKITHHIILNRSEARIILNSKL